MRRHFAFLENECGMAFRGTRSVGGDPRDSGLVATFSDDKVRVRIGWSDCEGALMILIRLEDDRLPRQQRSVYFEPFVEFITGGSIAPVIPHTYPGMSAAAIGTATRRRRALFRRGPNDVLAVLAERLRRYLGDIRTLPAGTLAQFHDWYAKHSGHEGRK